MKRPPVVICTALLGNGLFLGACGAGTPTAPAAPSPPMAPGISVPIAIAEGRPQPESAPLPSARAATEPPVPREPDLPDPEPLRLAAQWEYDVTYEQGQLGVADVRPRRFSKPVVTPRRVGRYAIELWIGRELVDRIRFDFPVVAAEEPTPHPMRPLEAPPSLAPGAMVHRVVLVPASPRATRAVLIDRATGEQLPLPWPPDRPLAPATGTAAAPPTPPAIGSSVPAAPRAMPQTAPPEPSAKPTPAATAPRDE